MNGGPAESGAVGQTVPLGVECMKCRYNLAGLGSDGNCPECGSAVAQSWPLVHLQEFLAKHAAPCPGCGRNLKGIEGVVCPSCGKGLTLRAVLAGMSRPRDSVVLALFLLDFAMVVIGLMVLLSGFAVGLTRHGPEMSWCAGAAALPVLLMVRLMIRKRLPKVVPLIRPPALADYLAATDAPCPACRYNLRGLTVEECPECALPLSVPLLHAHSVGQAGIDAKDVAKGVLTTFVVCVGGLAVVALGIGAVGVLTEHWSVWYLLVGPVVVGTLVGVARFLMRATKE